ncbi:hypothetical protein KGP36_03120 [Patescibacteria group bacterium]|nr:hypothetical protein [Patescibacteria group bacterium]
MYLTHPEDKLWASDIEGDDLYPAVEKVWCLCAINVKTGETVRLRTVADMLKWIVEQKANGFKFVFHNGLGYDAPTLVKVVKCVLGVNDVIDTMMMSMLYVPNGHIAGVYGHSLKSWGERLQFPKTEFDDFKGGWTQEMEDYCVNDAELCRRIYVALRQRMLMVGFTDEGLKLEHQSWALIQQQKRNGFHFNQKEAHILLATIRQKEKELEGRIHQLWPPQLTLVSTFKRPIKKDGSFSANYVRHLQQYDKVELGPDSTYYDCYSYVPFNIGSPAQRVERLLELGWTPREFTKPSDSHPNGQPKPITKGKLSPSLEEFIENNPHPGAALIAKWIDYNARGNMINTWLEAYNDDSGCIHGSLWLANTLRYRHSDPNTANIPAVRIGKDGHPLKRDSGVFTYEARDLWETRDKVNRKLVGVDAKGIQLRVLAHYLNNKEFMDAVVNGDPHSFNQEVGGFATRSIAKTFIYAFLLGAGDAKVGQIIGGSTQDGREIKERFINNFPGLADLLAHLDGQIKRTGRIVLCDGTPIAVTSPHTRLGYLLQGEESRIMKRAAVYTAIEVARRQLDVLKVGDIHDEWQNDVLNRDVQQFAEEVCPQSFRRAGESFNYRLPIDCDAKIGLTWAETH